MIRRPPRSTRTDTLFPYTTLFRSPRFAHLARPCADRGARRHHRTQRLHQCDEQDEARRRAGRSVLGLVDVADRGQTRRHQDPSADPARTGGSRSEERRVGKECVSTCRSRWSPYHYKKKEYMTNSTITYQAKSDTK